MKVKRRQDTAPGDGAEDGQAFILLALASVLLGLALVATFRFWGPVDDLRRATQNAGAEKVVTAIAAYAVNQGQLPCPDVTGAGLSPSPNSCGSATSWGLVPWQTLGLAPTDATDAWGRRFTYALATNATGSTPNICVAGTTSGGLAKWSGLTPLGGTVGSSELAYLIVNHGPHGKGAFQQSFASLGKQLPVAAGDLEANNCPSNVSGQSCPNAAAQTSFAATPSAASNIGANWFAVSVNNTQPFACYCTEPTLSGTLVAPNASTIADGTAGYVTASAAVTAPATCPVVWTSNIGSGGLTWATTASWNNARCSGPPTTTPAGQSCTVSAVLKSSGTLFAANQATSGWPSAQRPSQPSQVFTIAAATTTPASGTTTTVPAMASLVPQTSSGAITGYYASDGSQTTTAPSNSSTTLSLNYGAIPVTIVGSGGSASGTLCYDATNQVIAVLQSDGCYLNAASGDSLTVTAQAPAANLASFALLIYMDQTGQISVTETSGGAAPACSASDTTNAMTGVETIVSCAGNILNFTTTDIGTLDIPWQSVTRTVTVKPPNSVVTTNLVFDTVTIAPAAGAKAGLAQVIFSP